MLPRLALEARLHQWTPEQIKQGVHYIDRTEYGHVGRHLRFFSPHAESVFGPPGAADNLLPESV